jgi:NAD(P)-dependent dehydrogenase (short-subunit alcohol dehydrogenase family)
MDVSASNYNYRQAYAASKLANILFAYELADRLKTSSITSNAINPGGVMSRFALNNGVFSWMRHNFSHFIRRELRTATAAAAEIAEVICSETWERTSRAYISKGSLSRSSEQSYRKELMQELWDASLPLCRLNS